MKHRLTLVGGFTAILSASGWSIAIGGSNDRE